LVQFRKITLKKDSKIAACIAMKVIGVDVMEGRPEAHCPHPRNGYLGVFPSSNILSPGKLQIMLSEEKWKRRFLKKKKKKKLSTRKLRIPSGYIGSSSKSSLMFRTMISLLNVLRGLKCHASSCRA